MLLLRCNLKRICPYGLVPWIRLMMTCVLCKIDTQDIWGYHKVVYTSVGDIVWYYFPNLFDFSMHQSMWCRWRNHKISVSIPGVYFILWLLPLHHTTIYTITTLYNRVSCKYITARGHKPSYKCIHLALHSSVTFNHQLYRVSHLGMTHYCDIFYMVWSIGFYETIRIVCNLFVLLTCWSKHI